MTGEAIVVATLVLSFMLWLFLPYLGWGLLYGLAKIGVTPMWDAQILVFTKPRPDAPAQVFTFTGIDVRTRFIGIVRSQEATLAPAAKPAESRIVLPD